MFFIIHDGIENISVADIVYIIAVIRNFGNGLVKSKISKWAKTQRIVSQIF